LRWSTVARPEAPGNNAVNAPQESWETHARVGIRSALVENRFGVYRSKKSLPANYQEVGLPLSASREGADITMKLIFKSALVAAGISLAAATGGAAYAVASPSSSVSAQDSDSNVDGAVVDTDGTQGDYKPAMDGTTTANGNESAPQFKAAG